MIGLSVSGGGSRAAYLSAAVLREVHRSDFCNQVFIDGLDFVSSVSGGSVSSAYFVRNIDKLKSASADSHEWQEYLDKMAVGFRRRQWYEFGIFNPVTWIKSVVRNYNRGYIAREDYDRVLYKQATLEDFPLQPVLYINAFDVGNRIRFIFSRHYIFNEAYDRPWAERNLGEPQNLLAQNDLTYCQVDPKSVRIADAVYASSAFPFVYPHLPLHHFGTKIPYQGGLIFLADGGLADNSGLLTLLSQMKKHFSNSPNSRFVLAMFIDGSLSAFKGTSGTKYQNDKTEANHAWENTYLGHGIDSVDAAIDIHEDSVFHFLRNTGVVISELSSNYKTRLTKNPSSYDRDDGPFWAGEVRSGKLLLWPNVIGLRLQDILDAYYVVWSQYASNPGVEDPRLVRLFTLADIKEDFTNPAMTNRALTERLAKIRTDFVLRRTDRRILDLSAYLLVHGELEPALADWMNVAQESNGKKQ